MDQNQSQNSTTMSETPNPMSGPPPASQTPMSTTPSPVPAIDPFDATPQTPSPQPMTGDPSTPPPSTTIMSSMDGGAKKKSPVLLIVIMVVILLALAGAAYYFLMMRKASTPEPVVSTPQITSLPTATPTPSLTVDEELGEIIISTDEAELDQINIDLNQL